MGQLARKRILYWLRVLLLTVAGTALGHWLDQSLEWRALARYHGAAHEVH